MKPAKQEEDSLEPAKERQSKKIEISTKLVTRQKDSNADKKAQRWKRRRREAGQGASGCAPALSSADRTSGRAYRQRSCPAAQPLKCRARAEAAVPYANFMQAVKSRSMPTPGCCRMEWLTRKPQRRSSVTIARDGTVH